MNKEGIISFFQFDDVISHDPNYDPYVILEGYNSCTTPPLSIRFKLELSVLKLNKKREQYTNTIMLL